ncbi:flagellar FlbD family protein [Azotosporobacter soli]|uniref:flagellar FlbD family protein n=1 Tax=Azotosporobacter soli TaxID=3055040 RepID=UPI0031FE9396
MIQLSRLKTKEEFILNADLIETIEETPDTVITLTTGRKILVEEAMKEVVYRTVEYKRAIFRNMR